MDMEEELQQVEEEREDDGVHHNGRHARPLVRELHGPLVSGDLQQQPRRQHDEQDHPDHQRRSVHHLADLVREFFSRLTIQNYKRRVFLRASYR